MTSNLKTGAMIAVVLIVAACAPPPEEAEPVAEETTTTEADVEAINALADSVEEAYNRGDAAALIALHADDAVSMVPNQPALAGKEEISQAIQTAFASNTYNLSLSTDEVQVCGNWAFWRGTYSITITPAEGELIEDAGKVLNILQRQPDGSWKQARHIRNSDLSLPSTEGQ